MRKNRSPIAPMGWETQDSLSSRFERETRHLLLGDASPTLPVRCLEEALGGKALLSLELTFNSTRNKSIATFGAFGRDERSSWP